MVSKKVSRHRRGKKTSERIKSSDYPRLVIHRTPRHIYAQVIKHEDGASVVVTQVSTVQKDLRDELSVSGNVAAATRVGHLIAERLLEQGINQVAFDRRGFKYHGRLQALADAAREKGLKI